MLGHHIIRAYFDRVHKQVCKKVTLYLNKDMCAQGTLHPVWNTVRESHKTLLEHVRRSVCSQDNIDSRLI